MLSGTKGFLWNIKYDKGIELGQSVEMLTERISQRKAEKAELEEQLAIEQNKKIILTEPQIYAFLDYVCDMAADDINKRRAIINIFVHSVYLYDDYFSLIINASRKPLSIENIPLDEIESSFSGDTNTYEDCSLITDSVPPRRRGRHIVRGDFFIKVTARSLCRGSSPNRNRLCWVAIWFWMLT